VDCLQNKIYVDRSGTVTDIVKVPVIFRWTCFRRREYCAQTSIYNFAASWQHTFSVQRSAM